VAVGEAGAKYGSTDPADWKVPATCEVDSPPQCDQIVPTTAGAIDSIPSADKDDISKATQYVPQALSELAAGKPVSVTVTRPYGCSVKYAG
jgi:hypothetical protein